MAACGAVFITSLGRTGTHFLGNSMSCMIENCSSAHEADVLAISRPGEWWRKICAGGLFRSTVGKFSQRHSLRVLSVKRQTGAISKDEATECLLSCRREVVPRRCGQVYVEANWQYRGLIDILPEAFPDCRVVWVIRDPRSWITSWMRMSATYHSRWDYIGWFKGGRVTPRCVGSELDGKRWYRMSTFERLCWAWRFENEYAISCADQSPNATVFRYEDLFTGRDRGEHFKRLLRFSTALPDGRSIGWRFDEGVLQEPSNASRSRGFSDWRRWHRSSCRIVEERCGELMRRFKYGDEPEWIDRLACSSR